MATAIPLGIAGARRDPDSPVTLGAARPAPVPPSLDSNAAVAPGAQASRPGLLAMRFALLNLVACALLGAAWAQGLVGLVIAADGTRLCLVIFAVFLVGLGVCAALIWRTSRELDATRRLELEALGDLLEPIRRCDADQRGSLIGALRLRLSQRINVVRQIASNLVLLGLIGTVVGFIIALSGVDPSGATSIETTAPMVAKLIEGMSTALYTTLVGSILNIWLMACYQVLAGGTVRLIATLIENVEIHARPRLHR